MVIDHFGSGGAQRQLVLLAKELVESGCIVEFFVYYPNINIYKDKLNEYGLKVHSCEKSSKFSIKPILYLSNLLKTNKYDSVISFLSTPNIYAELANLINRRTTKLVVSERSCYPPGNSINAKTRIREQLHRLADAIVCNSFYQKERMIEQNPWINKKITTIINGVDIEHFSPDAKSIKTDFLVVARIDRGKNPLRLAQALRLIKDDYGYCPTINWVGKQDPSEDSLQYTKEVNEYLNVNKLQSNWNWMGEQKHVEKIMQNHKALILPSLFEGFPNVACEALACGLPILISNVCDNYRLLNNGLNGFSFDPQDARSIASSLVAFEKLSESDLAEKRAQCREYAVNTLSSKKYAENYLKLLGSL
ncbi:glycosyltransferase [Pleionea sp. CnH1-48]|uniref:glycosyltransferase n=1 Tax=Pleionea sp. CnH1-48 TaxID=2954494 RepID=UPI002096F8F3|nr:glycosyltransferase [Pleionea sp. CnH1-48]MCO7223792.1 glycosyltransferase [Pleionea sp. CnH1-48]